MVPPQPPPRRIALLVVVALAVLVWSGLGPKDRFTWVLEVAPGVAGMIVLAAVYPFFRFTPLVYTLVTIHVIILFVGGHYTYAEVPLFDWLRDVFGWSRNHFDRVGHFAQGFVPAMLAREVLLRRSPLGRGKWLVTFVLCLCLAISSIYELLEWQAAVWSGESATAFLGTQGDPWDTQKDMALCLVGAAAALALLSRWHDRQLRLASRAVSAGPSPAYTAAANRLPD